MVESRQVQIRRVDFESRVDSRLQVEVVERQNLLARVGVDYLAAPQRPSFSLLVLMRSQEGSHIVDFTEIPARPGRLVQIRPGQVHTYNTTTDLDATLVLAQSAVTSPLPWFPGHSSSCDLDHEAMTTAESLIDALRRHQSFSEGDQPPHRLMIALFDALVALFDLANTAATNPQLPEPYVAFRTAVEADLDHRHDVVDYARQLGYSARTITRACQKATGLTAKQILTDRLVLEAKRLLVHTDTPAAAISVQLGFSEPTNFTKFFTRNTTQTPSAFRHFHRQTA